MRYSVQAWFDIDPRITLSPAGLMLGATELAPIPEAPDHLEAADAERLEALFAVAFRRPPSDRDLSAIDAASTHWLRGDKALANLRLIVADLPQLHAQEDVIRLKAAELLFDAGLRTDDLASVFKIDPSITKSGHYDPNQPRVPAGSGPTSGRWTKLWERFSAWLDAEVPVYDADTGIEVGTQSRARAIVMNPVTVGVVGTATLLGGEALVGAGVVAAAGAGSSETVLAVDEAALAADETEALTAFAQRYLSTSGGRLGGTTTRQQLREIARDYVKSGKYEEFYGDGESPEEYIRGLGPGMRGSTFVDFTAKTADGAAVRVQTIDTLADGITPTKYELEAAARIRAANPNDKLILVPKRKP